MKNRKLIFQELFVDELKNRSRLGSVSVSLFFFLLNEILAKRLWSKKGRQKQSLKTLWRLKTLKSYSTKQGLSHWRSQWTSQMSKIEQNFAANFKKCPNKLATKVCHSIRIHEDITKDKFNTTNQSKQLQIWIYKFCRPMIGAS